MATMVTTKTETTDEFVDAASALRNDVEDIIAFLNRDLSPCRSVDVDDVSGGREEDGGGRGSG